MPTTHVDDSRRWKAQIDKARRDHMAALLARPKVNLMISCGCGCRFTDIGAAIDHSAEKRHILHFSGDIRPNNR